MDDGRPFHKQRRGRATRQRSARERQKLSSGEQHEKERITDCDRRCCLLFYVDALLLLLLRLLGQLLHDGALAIAVDFAL